MAVFKTKVAREKVDPSPGSDERATKPPLVMPVFLTPAMRKAWEKVPHSITEAERPYMERVWDALRQEVRAEQEKWFG